MHFLSLLTIAVGAALTAANPVNDRMKRDELGCPPPGTTCWQTVIYCAISRSLDCNDPTSDCIAYCREGVCFTCPGQCGNELDCSSITKEREVKRDLVKSCDNCQAWYNDCYYGSERNCLQYGLGSLKEAECAAQCQEDLCFDCPQNCGCP